MTDVPGEVAGLGSGTECPTGEVNCPEALRRLATYLDGELEDEQIREVAVHLEQCYPCGDRLEFERHLREVVRVHAAEVAPAGLLEKVRHRCSEAHRQA
ncbi:MAG TPA: zf-HC2 domain-containing protein [Nitriliruptorales bacterium]|nr:zf-HC2 domain-containing protein [Nitriliruptorales bacterium]